MTKQYSKFVPRSRPRYCSKRRRNMLHGYFRVYWDSEQSDYVCSHVRLSFLNKFGKELHEAYLPNILRSDSTIIATERKKYLAPNVRRFDFTDHALWRLNLPQTLFPQ